MKITEVTKDHEIVLRGYNPTPDIIFPSDSLCETLNNLSTLDINNISKKVRQMSLQDVFRDTKYFLDYNYRLHKVPYVKYYKVGKLLMQMVKNISPYKLPLIGIETEDFLVGSIIEEYQVDKENQPYVLFRGIELTKKTNEQSSATYVHEITHSQIDSIQGSIKNFYNMEVICLFNELYHSAVLDSNEERLKFNDARRIFEMKTIASELSSHEKGITILPRDTLLEDCKYLISDLKAYNLFITFYYGNNKIKCEILDCIQAIFDGYMTVEELLDKFDITYESSQEEKKLLKYFNR